MKSTLYVIEHARKDNWAGIKNYSDCKTFLRASLTRSGTLNTGLTKEDEARLESELGYEAGHLARSSKFWQTFAVVIDGKDLHLDISSPHEELQYLLCKAHKRVADGYERLNPSKDYVMFNKEQEAVTKNINNKKRIDAILEFSKMTSEDKRKAMRVLGLGSTNNSIDIIEATLYAFIDENADEFLMKWRDNADRDIEFLIADAVAANVLRKNKTSYYYGSDMIGTFLSDTVAFLKDKSNSDVRKAITTAIQAKKAI